MPAIRLAVAPTALLWRPSPWVRALTALPVHFPPTAPPPRPEPEPEPQPPQPAENESPNEADQKPRATNWAWWSLDL